MDINQAIKTVAVDVSKILFAGFPFVLYYSRKIFFNHRHSGGFFCDDRSLMLPYKGQTISSRAVLLQTSLVPNAIFFLVEYLQQRKDFLKFAIRTYRHIVHFTVGFLVAVSLM